MADDEDWNYMQRAVDEFWNSHPNAKVTHNELDELAARVRRETADRFHVPSIVKRRDGAWGVICAACSDAAQDYVYPCKSGWHEDFPPVLAGVRETAEAAYKDAANEVHIEARWQQKYNDCRRETAENIAQAIEAEATLHRRLFDTYTASGDMEPAAWQYRLWVTYRDTARLAREYGGGK